MPVEEVKNLGITFVLENTFNNYIGKVMPTTVTFGIVYP